MTARHCGCGADTEIPPLAIGLLVAAGCGLLIGIDRERRKGEDDDRAAAGIRTFTVTALCGALAQGSGQPALVGAGALAVIVLVAAAYFKSRSRDPGLTTELALFATYLVGVQAMLSPPIAAGCAAGLALLLAARQRLHRWATRALSTEELHDLLMLAALGLVVLPLVPSEPLRWLGDINPRPLAAMVLLILLLQGLGHVALRIAGPRIGLAASGFFSGFVSSTAAIASFGARARQEPRLTTPLASAAVLSSAATWLQTLAITAGLSTGAASAIAPMAGAGLLSALAVGALMFASAAPQMAPAVQAAADAPARGPLRLREALIVAALLGTVTWVAAAAGERFGATGVFMTAGIAGLADAHAPIASAAALFSSGRLSATDLVRCVLLAVSCNSVVRAGAAFAAGGGRFGAYVATGLLLGQSAAWAAAWVLG